jgi:beta-xylosidase
MLLREAAPLVKLLSQLYHHQMLYFSFFILSFLWQAHPPAPMHAAVKKAKHAFVISDTSKPQEAVIPGDFADPSVVRVGDTYYAAGTSSEWAPYFPLFKSNDLINWKQTSYAFAEKPAWAQGSFWAPELYYRNATFYLYYVAKRKSDGVSCIGVATSANPEKGFKDAGIILGPGQEVIDPFVIADKGVLYLTYKAYGLEKWPIELLAIRLSADGLKTEGQPFTLLRDDNRALMEGQCIVRRANQFYILYSVGGCCGKACSYAVKVAKGTSIHGPFTVLETPLLTENEAWKCPGHGTVVTAKNGMEYYLYHAYHKADDVYTGRQGLLAQMTWDKNGGWPQLKPIRSAATKDRGFEDDFSEPELSLAWQWDLQYDRPMIMLRNSALYLAGKRTDANKTGTAITIRPEKGNYTITTGIENTNASLKGIVLYGDVANAVGIGIENNMLQLWEVKKGVRTILKSTTSNAAPLWLRLQVTEGYKCRFFWSPDKMAWTEIKAGTDDFYNAGHLPPWDRSARPGLLHLGAENAPAVFSEFTMKYN